MRYPFRSTLFVAGLATLFAATGASAAPCHGPGITQEARPVAVRAYIQSTGRKVLTFAGYSGAGV